MFCNKDWTELAKDLIQQRIWLLVGSVIGGFFSSGATAPSGPGPPHYRGFTITLRHTSVGRTPLDEWSARHRDLYLTTHNTHNRQTSMPTAVFEPTIPVSERPKTHALDRTATGIGFLRISWLYFHHSSVTNVRFLSVWPSNEWLSSRVHCCQSY
jgi:hypothetical protein